MRAAVLWTLAALGLSCAAGAAGRRAGEGAPGATPLGAARAFFAAVHALDGEGAARHLDSPRARAIGGALVRLAGAYRDLERALARRFGPAAEEAVGFGARRAAEERELAEAREEVDGDRAVIRAGGREVVHLRRRDGAWRVEPGPGLAAPGGAESLAHQAEAARAAVDRVAPVVAAGLVDDLGAALQLFRNELARQAGEAAPEPDRRGPDTAL